MKKKTTAILSSCAAIAVCSSLIVGSTYALFTSESKVNVSVTSGKVDVVATVDEQSLALTSMGQEIKGSNWANGGTAGFTDKEELELTCITPGDGVTFNVNVTNNSTVNVKYRVNWSVSGDLADVLEAEADGAVIGYWSDWTVPATQAEKVKTVSISVILPEEVDNAYQEKSAEISFTVEAVQGNATVDGVTLPDGVTDEKFEEQNAVALAGGKFYPTLTKAIESGAGEVYLAPNAQLTEKFTHVHVSGSMNVYGNGATLTTATGEHDFELDTYPDRLGALTEDVTLNIYNLNGAAVWGQRTSDVTLNINLYNCEDVERVYISGEKGVNNITLNNCTASADFGTDCKLYSNAAGTIKVVGCTFNGVNLPVNLNNESLNEQNIYVTDCTFINCATSEKAHSYNYAAPIRVVATPEEAVSNLYLDNNTFAYSAGKTTPYGNILTVEHRPNKGPRLGTVNVYGEETNEAVVAVASDEDLAVLSKLQNGDTVLFAAGTVSASGDDALRVTANNVTLKGLGVDKTVIDCSGYEVSGQAGIYISGENVTIQDLTVKSTSTNGDVAALKISNVKNPVSCTVKNVNVYSEKGNGLTLHGVKDAVIDNVNVVNFGKCGISVAYTQKAVFTNCTIVKGGWGFDIGCMYNPDKESAYKAGSSIELGEGNDFRNGWIYGEYPEKGDTVTGYDGNWTLTDNEANGGWDLKKN